MAKGSYKKVITLGLDYSEFQGGMNECSQEMKKLDSAHKALTEEMENTSSGSEKLAEKNDYLSKKIQLQTKKTELAKEKLDELKSSSTATTSQINKATIAFNNETAELNRLNNELVQTNISQSNVKQTAAALVAVITAVGAAALSCVKDVAEYADELQTLSEQTGVSVQTLQEWDYASELIDTDFTTMTNAFKKLEAAMASSPEKFRELGVSVTDSAGNMRNAEDVYMETIDALGGITNATEQDQMAMEIFGKSATELTGMINAGSEGLKAYGMEAEALGVVLSKDEVSAAAECSDAIERLTSVMDAAKMKIGAELAPVITAIAEAIASIPAPVLATVAVVGSLIAIITMLVLTVSSVVKAFSGITGALALANPATLETIALITALAAILAVLAVAIRDIVRMYKEWKQAQEEVNKSASGLSETIGNVRGTGGGYSRGSSGSGGRGTGHNATGSKNWSGGLTWVGENGPELVDVPSGSRIYNSNESKQISNSPTYNISMNLDITKLKSVNDVVKAVQGLGVSAGLGGTV